MANWNDQLQEIQSLRNQRRSNDELLYATQINLSKTENLLQKIRQQQTPVPDHAEVRPLRQRIESLESQLREVSGESAEVAVNGGVV